MASKMWLGPKEHRIVLSGDERDIARDQYLDAPHPYTDPRWGDGARDPYFVVENKEREERT